MSPRSGRPTDNPKRHETRIRMSDEDVEILEYCCQKNRRYQNGYHKKRDKKGL